MKNEKKNEKSNIGSIALLVALSVIILAFSAGFIFNGGKSFSEEENRSLQTFPRFSVSKMLDGSYTEQLHSFYSDQISLRNILIELKAACELGAGKNENNGVLLGKDGYLIDTHEYTDENYSFIEKNTQKISDLIQKLNENGISAHAAIVPRKIDVLTDKLPPYYSTERNARAWSFVSGDGYLCLTDTLKKAHADGEQVYFKTDHHWTSYGAYCAYLELSELLGIDALPIESFELYTASDSFFGTSYSSSGFFGAEPDTLLLPKNDKDFTTEIVDTGASFEGFYDLSYLDTKDKYSVFISGNNAHVSVKRAGEERETLLLVKDSFSHALVPYLAEHFDLEIIDLRYYTDSLTDFIEENGISRTLFIYGLDTLASANVHIR